MPNAPKTPMHTIRIEESLWRRFGAAAGDRTGTIRDFIRWYVREPGARLPTRPRSDVTRSDSADHEGEPPHSAS